MASNPDEIAKSPKTDEIAKQHRSNFLILLNT
jgi:hypothetical protein